jgi:hypothetical protein
MTISKKKHLKKPAIFKHKRIIKTHEMELLERIEQSLTLDVDSFLVLSEEGDPTQVALAFQKAKNEYSKCAPEMKRIAEQIGGDIPVFVDDYLDSMSVLLHGQGALNEDLIVLCADNSARLKAELYKKRMS